MKSKQLKIIVLFFALLSCSGNGEKKQTDYPVYEENVQQATEDNIVTESVTDIIDKDKMAENFLQKYEIEDVSKKEMIKSILSNVYDKIIIQTSKIAEDKIKNQKDLNNKFIVGKISAKSIEYMINDKIGMYNDENTSKVLNTIELNINDFQIIDDKVFNLMKSKEKEENKILISVLSNYNKYFAQQKLVEQMINF